MEDMWDGGDVCALFKHVVSNREEEGVDGLLRDKAKEVLVTLEVLNHLLCAVAEGTDGALLRGLMLCIFVSRSAPSDM